MLRDRTSRLPGKTKGRRRKEKGKMAGDWKGGAGKEGERNNDIN